MFPWPQIHLVEFKVKGSSFVSICQPRNRSPASGVRWLLVTPKRIIKMIKKILFHFEHHTATIIEVGLVTSLCLSSLMTLPNKDKQRLVTKPQTTSRHQTKLNGRRVVFKVKEDLFHRFIGSFGTLTAT